MGVNDLLGKVFCGLESCTRGNGICQGVHCPYHKDRDETIFCRMNLVSDVCSLLQIDANAPRVLTLDEIDSIIYKSAKDYERLFWAESKSRTRLSFGVFQLDITTENDYEALLIGCSWPFTYRRETYGIKWRCWTARPTDEQRKKVKWDADVANQKEMV